MREWMSLALRSVSNRHRPGTRPNVFVFTTPRSGSTWLMELIQTQPHFKQCSEPLNLRMPGIARRLGISALRGSHPVSEPLAFFRVLPAIYFTFARQDPARR